MALAEQMDSVLAPVEAERPAAPAATASAQATPAARRAAPLRAWTARRRRTA
jgi:hypothetical protein